MKRITLLLSVCTLLLISCDNSEKEIVIVNSSNPKYDLGMWIEDTKNTFYTYSDIYSLWPEKVGKMQKDSLKRTNFKAFTVSKDSVVMSVDKGSKAESLGVRVGDILVNRDVEEQIALRRQRAREGTLYHHEFKRNGEISTVELPYEVLPY